MIAAQGNEEVISTLEQLLALAREGKAGYLAVMMLTNGQLPVGGWFGTPMLEPSANAGLKQMAGMWDAEILNRTLPPRDPGVPANRVCYNVPASPLSFDFINWLVDAETTRIREGAPAPLRICFWYGRDGEAGLRLPARRQMLENVIKPAVALIGAVEDPAAVDGREKVSTSLTDVMAWARAGGEVPKFRAPAALRAAADAEFGGAVTITLREATSWPHRNSDIDVWHRFACYLRSRGERIIVVRDTARMEDPFFDFETCPAASLDLHTRLAVYEAASMNLFVSNGPAGLAYFCDFPWMTFMKVEPDGHFYAPNTPAFWRDQIAMEVGQQYPWARPDQRIVWAEPTYENLVNAWNDEGLTSVAA